MKEKYSIECWIYNEDHDSFLLLQCPETEVHRSYWQPITGGIDPGETREQACIREVSEESGILFTENDITVVLDRFTVHVPQKDFLLVKPIYIARTKNTEVRISEEHLDFKWTLPDEVPGLLLWDSNRYTFSKVLEFLKEEQS